MKQKANYFFEIQAELILTDVEKTAVYYGNDAKEYDVDVID